LILNRQVLQSKSVLEAQAEAVELLASRCLGIARACQKVEVE
jgi:hypothetical protein